MAVREGIAVADVDVETLQEELLITGAYLRKESVLQQMDEIMETVTMI